MAVDVSQDLHLTASVEDELATDDLFEAVVTSFDEKVRAERLHERLNRRFGKQRHNIDVLQGAQQRGSILLLIDRRIPFELRNAVVCVEADDEQVAKGASFLQVFDVSTVQDIETAVGEHEALTGGAPGGTSRDQVSPGEKFVAMHGREVGGADDGT